MALKLKGIKVPRRKSATPGRPAAQATPATEPSSPISKGILLELDIQGFSHEGRGVARYQGKTCFVEGALPDERVQARVTEVKGRFIEAQTLRVEQASPQRIEPECRYASRCGGCSLWHLQADAQLQLKQQVLAEQLQRLGQVQPHSWLPPLQGPSQGYRRRAHLALRWLSKEGRLQLGFRAVRQQEVVEVSECLVLQPELNALLPGLQQLLAQHPQPEQLGHVELAAGDEDKAVLVRILAPLPKVVLQQWLAWAAEQHCQLWLEEGKGGQTRLYCPSSANQDEHLYYTMPAFALRLGYTPADFTQVNASVNQQMVKLALELLDVQPHERVLDLFCGLGNFSLPLARQAKQVVAVEASEAMVARGRMNASLNQLSNLDFVAADLMQPFSQQAWASQGFDKVLVDPPRAGAQVAMGYLAQLSPSRILYVSCNPATLARDAAELVRHGYRFSQAGAMDMFPQTAHIEAIALFEKAD
ncbi:23S rRNA (uracil(1939)-C(5))-methyltransferase RlmD [Balneatrix alpica]|uniref:23S rRNA (uracil(1939)-C(5))-methyltransferase RlmD n=1 Tax=Balneatrix alpica TaxID=75684 RepID=A0ABV5ZBL9_9GAMM|nr:23S rRNA (uracil(1939)-C(5))-methyltransferase RlmD [Balneatrix alpica]